MDVTRIMMLPYEIKEHVIDFKDVLVNVKGKSKRALCVLCDKVLTEEEKKILHEDKHVLNFDGIAHYKHAHEIQHSYFYIVY